MRKLFFLVALLTLLSGCATSVDSTSPCACNFAPVQASTEILS